MEMHQIRYFLAVCETLNFTRAADSCNVAQPSLTRAIQKLEEELGGPLFNRERSRTNLSALGRLMKPYLEQTFGAAEAAKVEAQSFSVGKTASLNLGVMCTIGPHRLINLINKLNDRIPSLKLQLREAAGQKLIDDLIGGDLDVAIVGLPDYPDTLSAELLYKERYVVAFPPGHRFEAMAVVPVAEMEGESYLERLNCEYPAHFSKQAGEWTCELNVRYQSEREDWIQAMILSGMGCSFLPEYISLFSELKTRVIVDPEIFRDISLVTPRGRRFSPATSAFVHLVRSYDWNAAAA